MDDLGLTIQFHIHKFKRQEQQETVVLFNKTVCWVSFTFIKYQVSSINIDLYYCKHRFSWLSYYSGHHFCHQKVYLEHSRTSGSARLVQHILTWTLILTQLVINLHTVLTSSILVLQLIIRFFRV